MKLVILLVLFLSSVSNAIALDDIKDLEGKLVVHAGDVEQLRCPSFGKYDCLTWPTNLLKFKYENVCFTDSSYSCGYFCSGLVAIGKDRIPYFFTFATLTNRISKSLITYYKCPDMY